MKKKLIVLSIDSMVSEDIAIMEQLPGFSEILSQSSVVSNVQSTYPTLTHPVHVSIASGCYPDKHGVITNDEFRPGEMFSPWLEQASLVQVPILPQAAKKLGYTTASVFWPLTIGMDLDWVIGRAWVHEKRKCEQETIRDNSTPGLYDELKDYTASAWGKEHYTESDDFCFLATEYILRKYQPDITYLHVILIDHIRHAYGVFSPQLAPAYEFLDQGLQRLIRALKDNGSYDNTIFCITSDHGQQDIDRVVSLNRFLLDKGLIRLNEDGSLKDWDVYAHSASLNTYIHIAPDCPLSSEEVYRLFWESRSLLGIDEILSREEAKERFRLDGDFSFVLESDGHTAFSPNYRLELITAVNNSDYRTSVAGHGHMPHKGALPAFILRDPFHPKTLRIHGGNIVDQAPTLAALLDIPLPDADGVPIEALL